jgi:transcriptional regulator of nitric oxide reductase
MQALKQCPAVEVISGNTIRVLVKGDEVIVKLALP